MNTQEQKTPEQWFQALKEPYRSEAIKGIDKNVMGYKDYPESLEDALMFCIFWWNTSRLKTTRDDWGFIYESIKAGETTYLETEQVDNTDNLKPEQMESGKWYVIETRYKFLSKFKEIIGVDIHEHKGCSYYGDKINDNIPLCRISEIKSIRPATKEEVLKYFPDEVFEPIELKPEDLVNGEVYTLIDEFGSKTIFKVNSFIHEWILCEISLINNNLLKCLLISKNWKFYHATQEEKELLLGKEEPTDWKAKFEELQKEYENEKDLRGKWAENYFKLKEEYNELFKKQNNQGEKVYFYTDYNGSLKSSDDIQIALERCGENYKIFEANIIGKKKSVLVNE